MDKSLEARRVFNAANKRMLDALNESYDKGDTSLLENISIIMPASIYERLIDTGRYQSVKRKKGDRRAYDRRTGDRRKSGKR